MRTQERAKRGSCRGWSFGFKAQRRLFQGRARQSDLACPSVVAQQSVVPDFSKAVRQQVQKETAKKFGAGEGHGFGSTAGSVILIGESDGALLRIQSPQPGVADGHPVSVAAQVVQDVVGADHRTFGKNDPALGLKLAQQLSEGGGLGQGVELTLELELAGGVQLPQPGAELAAE